MQASFLAGLFVLGGAFKRVCKHMVTQHWRGAFTLYQLLKNYSLNYCGCLRIKNLFSFVRL
jgi:hypothetical protein